MGYILALCLLCVAYASVMYCMKHMKNTKRWNLVFTATVFVPYVVHGIIVYLSVGFYDWNFQNLLPTANVSPFMFCLTLLILLLPKRARGHFHLLISLLTVGMFFSSVLGCVYNTVIHYKFHIHFVLDYLSHFALSLFGVYLVRSGQAKPACRASLHSSAIIFGVAFFMMGLNLIFDTAFFGLSLAGKHNIYNNVLVESSYLSAGIYLSALAVVLALGYGYSRICARIKIDTDTQLNPKRR